MPYISERQTAKERGLVGTMQLMKLMGISTTHFYALRKSGTIPAATDKVGRLGYWNEEAARMIVEAWKNRAK